MELSGGWVRRTAGGQEGMISEGEAESEVTVTEASAKDWER